MIRAWTACALIALVATGIAAQSLPGASKAAASPPPAAAGSPKDHFGRTTPRGTVVGFLSAERRGDHVLAAHYLNVPSQGQAAQELARQLFVVLDARLPARIPQVSDVPEGSRGNPLALDQELVGTIQGPDGPVDVILERVTPPKADPIWLVSARTLDAIPALYADVARVRAEGPVRRYLFRQRIGGVRLFDWLAVVVGLPALYFLTVILNRALTPVMPALWRRLSGSPGWTPRSALPAPARLLLLALASHWLFARLPVSLLVRQSLSNLADLVAIIAAAWLLVRVNGAVERHLCRRLPPANYGAALSLLRVARRMVDILVVLVALVAVLRRFGVETTPVLAGLGVGGIAIALAAQKTLENIIAGASLIFDQAVRVGDFLKVGEIQGTVDHIGLRSTRIRTLDRTIVSVPNGQVATMVLETLSERDKFWFHPIIGLRYETTPDQLRAVLTSIERLLSRHAAVEPASIRVRFLRLGQFSMDVEAFAYVRARDWSHFLEIQQDLLLAITEIVRDAGTAIAFPSHAMYVEGVGSR